MKPIHIAASPNTQGDDLKIAWSKLVNPWNLAKGKEAKELEELIGKDLKGYAFTFDSARSAFYVYLKSLDLLPKSEVILPAFSCMVVANAVLWAGLKPVFVDCNENDFNYDLADLKKKLTSRTRVILIQHTFGFPEDIAEVRTMAGKSVIIVEDLAHSLGGNSALGKLGTLADAAILTFGIEKVISGVRGGMVIVRDNKIAEELALTQEESPAFPFSKTIVALLNPILWYLFTPSYYFGIGKFTLGRMLVALAHKLGLFGNMIEPCEYRACKPDWLPSRMSPALAALALNQYRKLDRMNAHRVEIAKLYLQELNKNYPANDVYLRFPLLLKNRKQAVLKTKEHGIVLGDWYKSILYAPDSSLQTLQYVKGSCPNAERLADQIVNLPTHINVSTQDARRVVKVINQYL